MCSAFAMLSIQIVFMPSNLAANNVMSPGAAPVLITASGDSLRRIRNVWKISGISL